MLGYILNVPLKTKIWDELGEDGECDQISLCEFLKELSKMWIFRAGIKRCLQRRVRIGLGNLGRQGMNSAKNLSQEETAVVRKKGTAEAIKITSMILCHFSERGPKCLDKCF